MPSYQEFAITIYQKQKKILRQVGKVPLYYKGIQYK